MEARLIPGLPDCIALHCLLHLPFHAIPSARAVCKRWNHELASSSFYRLRRDTGMAHRVVAMLFRGKLSHTVGKLHLALYEPATDICMIRQLAANRTNNSNRCSKGTIFERELLVFGGWDVLKNCRTGEVHIYDLVSGACRTGAAMPIPKWPSRQFGLQGGKVFVVCKKLRSGLVYDVAIDTWLQMSDLDQNTCQADRCDKFWRRKGEYNSAIQWCKKLLLLDDKKYRTRWNLTTIEEKEILVIEIPELEESETDRVILSTHALETLQRQLGLLPNEIKLYIESVYRGHL